MCIQWPIRWYDVLSALVAMTEIDRVDDPGCTDALGILAGKRLKTGGFPVEERTAKTVDTVTTGGTFADWGPTGGPSPTPTSASTPHGCLERPAPKSICRRTPAAIAERGCARLSTRERHAVACGTSYDPPREDHP